MEKKLNGMNVTHIDTDTGEIICQTEECTEIKDSTMSAEEKAKKEYEETHVINFNEGKSFVKLFTGGINELRRGTTPTEFVTAISLCEFVCYDDCALRKGGKLNGHILSTKDLSEEMNIPYETLRKIISSLIKKGILAISKTGCKDKPSISIKTIFVNPNIYMKGQDVNLTAIALFEGSNW